MPAKTKHCSPASGNNCTWQHTTHNRSEWDVNCWTLSKKREIFNTTDFIDTHFLQPSSIIWWKSTIVALSPAPPFVLDWAEMNTLYLCMIFGMECDFWSNLFLLFTALKFTGIRQWLSVSYSVADTGLWPSERTECANRKTKQKLFFSLGIN